MTTWVVIFLLANNRLVWTPAERNECVSIEEQVLFGKGVSITTPDGLPLEVLSARCMPRAEAERRFGLSKREDV
jgi:hypothetical protein